MSGDAEPVVEVRGLTRRFGEFVAVDRVDFEVRAGEIFGFLGSNGAGKTTVIRMLCGLLAPSSGSASVLGLDIVRDAEKIKRRIGYMSQRFSLYDDLTVAQNLRFFGGVYGLRGEDFEARRAWAVETAELVGKEEALTGDLPGGWKQRLALASALLHRPAVVFLDEPTGGVDPMSRRAFWRLIDGLAAEGTTVFVTTHYLDEAERCHRLALMHAGRLLELGTVDELRGVFADRALFEIRCPRPVDALEALRGAPFALDVSLFGSGLHLSVAIADADSAERGAREILTAAIGTEEIETARIVPSLEDVFLRVIERSEETSEPRREAA